MMNKSKFSYADILKQNAKVENIKLPCAKIEEKSELLCEEKKEYVMSDSTEYTLGDDEKYNEYEYDNYEDTLKPWKLQMGKKPQKGGDRLEKAFYNSLPKNIKNSISVNYKPRYPNGNVIVEFDMIYRSDSSKIIISFEIKGVNKYTIDNRERQNKLISQGLRQKKYLSDTFSDYKVETIYCFVTGQNKSSDSDEKISKETTEWKSVNISNTKKKLDNEFIKRIKQNNINVAIGETPLQCAKKAIHMMGLLR